MDTETWQAFPGDFTQTFLGPLVLTDLTYNEYKCEGKGIG